MARVLVVDDDLSVADAISRMLGRRGHETVVVHNGKDAIRAAQTQSPDLVVLDIVMPGMDGVEVCRRLRADPQTEHLPILFLTAQIMIDDKTWTASGGTIPDIDGVYLTDSDDNVLAWWERASAITLADGDSIVADDLYIKLT